MIILYADDGANSFNLISTLDEKEINYEIKGASEAERVGFFELPVLVVDEKIMSYSKAKKWIKRK